MKKEKKVINTKSAEKISNQPGPLDEIEAMSKDISELSELLEANLSYWNTLKHSVLRGFGAAIGATIIIALAVYLIDRFFASVGYIPVLTPFLEYIYTWLQAA